MRWVDEHDGMVGWVEPPLARTSHALVAGGGVWLLDPVDAPGVEERVRVLGEPRGVIQLLDRHGRDSAAWAERLGVPLLEVPVVAAGLPFEVLPLVRSRFWRESALWEPERRVLVCGDALGTLPYFRAGDERIGVHPFLRLAPPRALTGLEPLHVLVGHGEGLHGEEAAPAVLRAVEGARRGLPRLLAGSASRLLRRG